MSLVAGFWLLEPATSDDLGLIDSDRETCRFEQKFNHENR